MRERSLRFILCCCVVLLGAEADAQVRLGIKGGLSTSDIPASTLLITDERSADRFRLAVDNAKYGIHLGMFVQAQFNHFFIQPEILFNTATVDYSLEDLQQGGGTIIRDEMYRNLDIPFMAGFKFGPVRLGAGPVGHIYLDNTSDLQSDIKDEAQYRQEFDRLTWGWQAGIGLDIWKLHLDARYEGNLDRFGNHFVFYDRPYSFSERPSRIIVSAGISF